MKTTDSVRIVVFDKDDPDVFLVLCEADDEGNWKLPGGKFEEKETPDEAATRELDEELGLDPVTAKLQMAGELTNDDGISRRYIYKAQTTPESALPSDEIAEIKWIKESQIPEGKNRSHILTALHLAQSKV